MISILKRMFSGRRTPDQIISKFRSQAEAFDGEQADLNYHARRQRGRIEAILNRGKEAANNGDSIGKRQAAMELKCAQLEAAAVEKDLMQVLNARTFVRLTLRKLERCSRNQLGRAYEGLGRLMKAGNFQKLMAGVRYNGADTEAKIEAALGRAFDEAPEEAAGLALDTNIFDELADADKAGDVERVKALKRKAGGRPENFSVGEFAGV